MTEFVSSIAFIVLGAIIGAVVSYIASYRLQLHKLRVEAALLRKEQIYGPIFDELAGKESRLNNYRDWARPSSIHRFNEWDKHRNTSLGLLVPKRLKNLFEAFTETCRLYNKAGLDLNQRLQTILPERHNDVDHWVVAMLLADKMLVAPDEKDRIAIEYLKKQRPMAENINSYWSDARLNDLTGMVIDLNEFKNLANIHQKYSNEVQRIKNEVESRIERIVKRYQTPLNGL